MSKFPSKKSCPRCGAPECHQKFKPRTVDYGKREFADGFNPVDAVICHHCGQAFRVSRLEYENGWIVNWQTEYEFTPRFCPSCGNDLKEDAE